MFDMMVMDFFQNIGGWTNALTLQPLQNLVTNGVDFLGTLCVGGFERLGDVWVLNQDNLVAQTFAEHIAHPVAHGQCLEETYLGGFSLEGTTFGDCANRTCVDPNYTRWTYGICGRE